MTSCNEVAFLTLFTNRMDTNGMHHCKRGQPENQKLNMDVLTAIIGVLGILFGVCLINFYQNLVRKKKQSDFSFKLRTGGIGLIIIGIGLIVKSCK